MKTIKIQFSSDFLQGDAELRKTLDDMFQMINPGFGHCRHIWRPPVDIFESPREFIILVALAGVKMEDIQLVMGRRTMKLSGKRYERPILDQGRYRLAEIPHGIFERTVILPSPVDTGQIQATHADGLLMIRMAKAPLDKGRHIPVKNG